MRVAFVTHTTSLYGANRSLIDLLDGLRGSGVDGHVVSPNDGPFTRAVTNRSIPVAVHPIQWWMSQRTDAGGASRRWKRNLRCLPQLARQLDRWRVDLVHSNSSVIPVGAMACALTGRPHVWHVREMATLHYGFSYDWGVDAFREAMGKAEALAVMSRAIRRYLVRRGIAPSRMQVVYDGVASAEEFDRRYGRARNRAPSRSRCTFAVIGALYPNKGQWIAIQALGRLAARFPRARLWIVGGGNPGYAEGLRMLVRRLGLGSRVKFWGYRGDLAPIYLSTDAVLVCSRHEGIGRVAAEAMSFCRPVIGYDEGGTSELIKDGKTGLLYRGGAEELAGCMRRFLEDPSCARRMGKDGWRAAQERFTTEAHTQRMLRIFEEVLNGGGSDDA